MDVKIVLESYNGLVEKMRLIVEEVDDNEGRGGVEFREERLSEYRQREESKLAASALQLNSSKT